MIPTLANIRKAIYCLNKKVRALKESEEDSISKIAQINKEISDIENELNYIDSNHILSTETMHLSEGNIWLPNEGTNLEGFKVQGTTLGYLEYFKFGFNEFLTVTCPYRINKLIAHIKPDTDGSDLVITSPSNTKEINGSDIIFTFEDCPAETPIIFSGGLKNYWTTIETVYDKNIRQEIAALKLAIEDLVGLAPEDLDTIAEAAQAIVTIEGDVENIQRTIDGLNNVYAPKVENGYIENPDTDGVSGLILSLDSLGNTVWSNPPEGSVVDSTMSDISENPVQNKTIKKYVDNHTPAMAETLAPWADQKAIATPDTYTDAVRTTGGDIPIETSAGSKLESIKPVAGSKWTAKMLFNGSYNMLNAVKWGAANSQPYVGGVGSGFVYFLVPELTLGTFGTADENNGLLFTDSEGENVQPASVYFKPLGATVPQSLTDGTAITPTSVSYDGNTYNTYETSGAGWLIIPKTYYDNDVCAHIAWEDWYDKHISLDAPNTNPEAVVGVLILEGLLALAHSDKYLRGINEEVCDNVVFGDTSATITHMVDELSVAANAWTNAATGESDSQGNALYRHSATVSLIKQGGAACIEGEDGGIPLTVNGTTVSYVDTNAAAPASTVFYQIPTTEVVEKAYTDSVFSGSNIDTETGVLPINDCSIEAQVAMAGTADITVKYAKNIVDQVAINATVDVPQIQKQVENHEERIVELEDTAVRTGSYDASVAVGLADNFKGDTIVNAEFYKRKTGGTQSVGSGIAAIKEVRGKSIVWNQLMTSVKEQSYTTGLYYKYLCSLVLNHKYLMILWIKQDGTLSCNYTKAVLSKGGLLYGEEIRVYPSELTTEYKRFSGIVTSIDDRNTGINFYTQDYSAGTIYIKENSVKLIDLTLMFGANNEPATVEEFEKMFPLEYYAYNAGEVIPFAGQNLTTIGQNQYNPTTGKANLLGGQTYQLLGTYTGAEIDEVAVTLDSNDCFTTTKDCVLDVAGGNDTDTIVALYNGENVSYEPYEKHTLPLDPSQWRDKNGELVFPYGGMHGVGTAYDYAKVDADGYIRKAVRCFGQVDLGSVNYILNESRFEGQGGVNGTQSFYDKPNFICPKYMIVKTVYNTIDKALGGYFPPRIAIFDSAYTDATELKKSLQGVPLYYELAEPVEVELATPIYAKYLVDKDGTEEISPANGTKPYTTPANLSILYAMDARGEIKNLPKNYLSKESAENMLNAMVSAGVIASYTMTYDVANGRYAFVITAPVEPEENTQS